jgi:hypothetical protein
MYFCAEIAADQICTGYFRIPTATSKIVSPFPLQRKAVDHICPSHPTLPAGVAKIERAD